MLRDLLQPSISAQVPLAETHLSQGVVYELRSPNLKNEDWVDQLAVVDRRPDGFARFHLLFVDNISLRPPERGRIKTDHLARSVV